MYNYSWSSDYSVGDFVLDDHHKTLLNLFHKISDILFKEDTYDEIKSLLSELKTYTRFHFAEEEKRMIANNYPDYLPHKEKHETFIKEINSLQVKVDENYMETTEDLFIFMNQWLITHIQQEDMKYVGKI